MADKNIQISSEKIQNILEQLALSPKDHLPEEELSAIIARLNEGPFDKDTFQQIWDQCQLNSKGQVRLSQFMEYILKAESILLQNIKNTNIAISKLENHKPDQNDYSQLHNYRQELDSLYQQKQSLKVSLDIIRKPFRDSSAIALNHSNNMPPQEDPQQQLFEYDFKNTASTLTKIMYLTLGLMMLTWLGSQMFNQFIDMTLCLVILTGYAFQSISRKIIKFNLVLLGFSFVYSIIWLILYTVPLWSPRKNYEYAAFTAGYLQFSICMLVLTEIVKLIIIYYYLTQLHINELQAYSISFCYKTILMQAQPSLQPQYPLSYALMYIFNPKVASVEQPEKGRAEPLAE